VAARAVAPRSPTSNHARSGFFHTSHQTTALGAACLAGLSAGVDPETSKFADNWRLEHRFKPAMSAEAQGMGAGGEG
jgi:hypothetical protein